MVIAAMALIGLGCAPILMAPLFIYARSYSPARFAVLASWTIAFGTAGNVIGAAPLAAAAEAFGWRPVIARSASSRATAAGGRCPRARSREARRGSATGSSGLSRLSASCSRCACCGRSSR